MWLRVGNGPGPFVLSILALLAPDGAGCMRGTSSRAALFSGRSRFFILPELPGRPPDEESCDSWLARRGPRPLLRAYPILPTSSYAMPLFMTSLTL
jgi:hypothetical protein